jgi:HEAT repeat protein
VQTLIELAKDASPEIRHRAASLAAGIKKPAAALFPQMVELLRDPDQNVRRAAWAAILEMGSEAKKSLGVLREILASEKSDSVRSVASEVLSDLSR